MDATYVTYRDSVGGLGGSTESYISTRSVSGSSSDSRASSSVRNYSFETQDGPAGQSSSRSRAAAGGGSYDQSWEGSYYTQINREPGSSYTEQSYSSVMERDGANSWSYAEAGAGATTRVTETWVTGGEGMTLTTTTVSNSTSHSDGDDGDDTYGGVYQYEGMSKTSAGLYSTKVEITWGMTTPDTETFSEFSTEYTVDETMTGYSETPSYDDFTLFSGYAGYTTTNGTSTQSYSKTQTVELPRNDTSITSVITVTHIDTIKTLHRVGTPHNYEEVVKTVGIGNFDSFEMPKGNILMTRATINTSYHGLGFYPEEFWVFDKGVFDLEPKLYKFEECAKIVRGQHQWTNEIEYLGTVNRQVKYENGEGGASITETVYGPQGVTYDTIKIENTNGDSSPYFIDSIVTTSRGIPGSTQSFGGESASVIVGNGFKTTREELYTYNIATILKVDPLNYSTSEIRSIGYRTITYNQKIAGSVTNYYTAETSSSTSNESNNQNQTNGEDDFGEWSSGYESGWETGSASEGDYTREITNELVWTSVTNEFAQGAEADFGRFAIVPDFKKGYVAFSGTNLYGGYSRMSPVENRILMFDTYQHKNYNQTKIIPACRPFTTYETATVTNVSYLSNSITLTHSFGQGFTYTNSSANYSTVITNTTTSITYYPKYVISSSIIDDKKVNYSYSFTVRGQSTSEITGTDAIELFDLLEGTSNFKRMAGLMGGCLPEETMSWTFFYKGYCKATHWKDGVTKTITYFNTGGGYSSSVFGNGEAIEIDSLPLFKVGGGNHFYYFSSAV